MSSNNWNHKKLKKYDRVLSRVHVQSCSTLNADSYVTRHERPSPLEGAKPPGLNVTSGVFSELPTVLNDYVPPVESEKSLKHSSVIKPRRTIKSLDPALGSSRATTKTQENIENPRNLKTKGSAPSVLYKSVYKWPNKQVRPCDSSESHLRLKDLKEEIKAFDETDKLLRLRSKLYKSCGVVLDNVGEVAVNKAVQAEIQEHDQEIERKQLLESSIIEDLQHNVELFLKQR